MFKKNLILLKQSLLNSLLLFINMCKYQNSKNPSIRVDKHTYKVLKDISNSTGVSMSKQIKFKVFGKAAKVKKVFE